MLGQLVVIAGPDQGRIFSLQEGEPLVIGRGQDTATRLKDPQVSRIHCQVKVEGNKALLISSSTKSPMLVNGKTISPGRGGLPEISRWCKPPVSGYEITKPQQGRGNQT